ncbi:MAG: hypothetical protein ABGX16_05935 [Pirellulales bacterium]
MITTKAQLKNLSLSRNFFICFLVFCCMGIPSAWALSLPFTEDFATGGEKWLNFNGSAEVAFSPTDGPDGSSICLPYL